MKKMQRIWIAGAGAVGGYMAAHLQRAGHDVHVFDGWAAHVDAINQSGLTIEEPDGRSLTHLSATLLGQAPAASAEVVVLACKMAQTADVLDWLERDLGYRGLYIATLNGLADAEVARRVGADRVLGCIVSGLHGELLEPGRIARRAARGGPYPVFRLGEVAGPISTRARLWADVLASVDVAVAVDDLKGERWTKLQYNAMTSALSAVLEHPVAELFLDPAPRKRMIDIGLEVVAVAEGHSIALGPVCGVGAETWRRAARDEANAMRELEAGAIAYGEQLDPAARSGSAQDRARGRASEVDMINGAVVREAEALGGDAPANRALRDELVAIEKAAGSRPQG